MAQTNRIKQVLTEQGKTTKWLAEQVGKSSCTVGQWCSNKCQPKPELLDAVSKALGVEKEKLIEQL